jgi:hypothetical protein
VLDTAGVGAAEAVGVGVLDALADVLAAGFLAAVETAGLAPSCTPTPL